MKRVAVLVSVVVVASFWYGCGARVEVAKDKVKQKIDSLLGTMDVKRKEIELGISGLKEGIDGLRKAKIKAQVATEQLGRQAFPQEEKLASMDSALKTLRGHLEGDKPVEIAGKTYSPAELKELADRVPGHYCVANRGWPLAPGVATHYERRPVRPLVSMALFRLACYDHFRCLLDLHHCGIHYGRLREYGRLEGRRCHTPRGTWVERPSILRRSGCHRIQRC